MPTPKKDETENEWMGRCVPALIDEGRPQEQAVAICRSMWRNRGKKKEGEPKE